MWISSDFFCNCQFIFILFFFFLVSFFPFFPTIVVDFYLFSCHSLLQFLFILCLFLFIFCPFIPVIFYIFLHLFCNRCEFFGWKFLAFFLLSFLVNLAPFFLQFLSIFSYFFHFFLQFLSIFFLFPFIPVSFVIFCHFFLSISCHFFCNNCFQFVFRLLPMVSCNFCQYFVNFFLIFRCFYAVFVDFTFFLFRFSYNFSSQFFVIFFFVLSGKFLSILRHFSIFCLFSGTPVKCPSKLLCKSLF